MLYLRVLLQLLLQFILSYLPSIMQQYQDLKLNPIKIRHCTTCFGFFGNRGAEIEGNCRAFRATAISVFVFTVF
jgi:hypothetical protein